MRLFLIVDFVETNYAPLLLLLDLPLLLEIYSVAPHCGTHPAASTRPPGCKQHVGYDGTATTYNSGSGSRRSNTHPEAVIKSGARTHLSNYPTRLVDSTKLKIVLLK